jgi:hypothetical protein
VSPFVPDELQTSGERVPPAGDGPAIATGTLPWPKRYALVARGGIVGYTDLEVPIVMRKRAAGFVVTADAWESVRDVFRLYREAGDDRAKLQQFVVRRNELSLVVTDGGTLPLAATLELISEWRGGRIAVHVAIEDSRYWSARRF